MAWSEVDIWNLAGERIGSGQSFANTSDRTSLGRSCARFFPIARDATFEAVDWAFARRYEAPALLAVKAPGRWAYAYKEPPSCVAVRRVLDAGLYQAGAHESDAQVPFEVASVGDANSHTVVIATNCPAVILRYTRQILGSAYWPATFVEVVAWRLAADLAAKQSGGVGLRQECLRSYLGAVDEARGHQLRQAWDRQREAQTIEARR